LSIPPDLPLGAYPGASRRNTEGRLPTGACLFLYTDGLVERRDASIAAGIGVLVDTLTCAAADTVCATAMATMFSDRAASDDVAILAVRRTGA
jgi:serine phosphatase RsbU (regulator of sigma subunit)